MNDSEQLSLSQALDIYCQHLGLPDDIAKKVKAFAFSNADDVIWLSDQPLMVYRDGSDLVVNSEEFTKLLENVNPIQWPDSIQLFKRK